MNIIIENKTYYHKITSKDKKLLKGWISILAAYKSD